MPHSCDHFNGGVALAEAVADWLARVIPRHANVYDVGAGSGSWGRRLKSRGFNGIDAVEVWPPNIEQFNLRSIYRTVYLGDAKTFRFLPCDLAVMGDVLEHLSVQDALTVVGTLCSVSKQVLIGVPHKYVQGPIDGNDAEIHLQDDLDVAVMTERYGEYLEYLAGNAEYSYWIKRRDRKHPIHPRILEIDLTHKCNVGCMSCNRVCTRAPTSEMLDLSVLDAHLKDRPGLYQSLIIIGGEPTEHPEFARAVDLARAYQGATVAVWSHGLTHKARKALEGLPADVGVHITERTAQEPDKGFEPFNYAPLTVLGDAEPYEQGCNVLTDCGRCLGPNGKLYVCPCMSAIDRVFKLNIGTSNLTPEVARGQCREACQLCGWYFRNHPDKVPNTQNPCPIWQAALKSKM